MGAGGALSCTKLLAFEPPSTIWTPNGHDDKEEGSGANEAAEEEEDGREEEGWRMWERSVRTESLSCS